MLRPIDTQTIYQQSQEISNRQQAESQKQEMQQVQFADLFQRETAQKQEAVGEVQHDEKIKNQLNQQEGRHQPGAKQKYKNKKQKEKPTEAAGGENLSHIDIRI